MTLEEFKQRNEEAIDYLADQLEENPSDFGAYQFYLKQVSDINQKFVEEMHPTALEAILEKLRLLS